MSQDTTPVKPTIFISYAHEGTLGEQVRELVTWLKNQEVNVISDHPYANRPPEKGWRGWMHHSIKQADAVLIVCTARYKQLFQKDEIPEQGGIGATWESAIITDELYRSYLRNTRFYPILPDGGDSSHIPDILQDWNNNHRFPSGNERILALIREVSCGTTSPNTLRNTSPRKPSGSNARQRPTREGKGFARGADVPGAAQAIKISSAKPPSVARTSRAPMEATTKYDLTVRFSRNGNTLQVDYIPAGHDLIPGLQHNNWSKVEIVAKAILQKLSDIGPVIREDVAIAARKNWGPVLFQLLFGKGKGWDKATSRIISGSGRGADPITPFRYPIRLRIAAAEPVLLALPWRLTAWNRHLLTESPEPWEFLTVQDTETAPAPALNMPCEVIVIGPRNEAAAGHCLAIMEGFKQDWAAIDPKRYLRFVADAAELREALKGMRPRVVYVHGWAENQGFRSGIPPQPGNDDEIITLADLAGLLGRNSSRPLLILNAPGPAAAGQIPPSTLLGGVVSGLVWTRLTQRSPEMDDFLLNWLQLWRKNGGDPFTALGRAAAGNGLVHALLGCHCNYHTWLVQKAGREATSPRKALHRLDRKRQKSLFLDSIHRLINEDERRVMAMVAYAADGNKIEALPTQLKHYIEEHGGDRIQVNCRKIEFPIERQHLYNNLQSAFITWLADQDNEYPKHVLRKHMPRLITAGRSVLWLDWGVPVFDADGLPERNLGWIQRWLEFCVHFLCEHCPDDHRIVSSLGLELGEEMHADFLGGMQHFKRQPWCRNPAFLLHVADPLGKVSEDDLFEYLDVQENLKCLPEYHIELTERIMRKTGGDFEKTVSQLEKAQQQGNCFGLLDGLREEQGEEPPGTFNDDGSERGVEDASGPAATAGSNRSFPSVFGKIAGLFKRRK